MTTYTVTLASGLGGSSPSLSDQAGLTTPSNTPGADVTQSSKQRETRYTIEERFSDFKTDRRPDSAYERYDSFHRGTAKRHDQCI